MRVSAGRASVALVVVVALLGLTLLPGTAIAAEPGTGAFGRTWARTDQPVANLVVHRTWMWGPEATTGLLQESYADSPGGQRTVQYFDKSRMEITHPEGDQTSIWYVTNGLLAKELITGQMQLGDTTFEAHPPAQVNVAGDPNDPAGPTYATFHDLMGYAPVPDGWVITQTVDRVGNVGNDDSADRYRVSARDVGAPTRHTVASVFWDFMTSSGPVQQGGQVVTDTLFANPFYATGYPLTEAYWTHVKVGGVAKQVLVQVFERRVLTYTPDNPDGWTVEAGNVGQHYHTWRYQELGKTPVPAPQTGPVIVLDPGHDASTGGAQGVEYRDTYRTGLATKAALEAAGYTVYLTRPDEGTILYGAASLMPDNAGRMDQGYNEGYAHLTQALQFNPDLVISLHYNAADSTRAAGMTVYYCDNGGAQNRMLAGLVRDELLTALRSVGYEPPYADATEDDTIGKVYGHLATLGNVYSAPFAYQGNRLVGIPAVLTEPLFETNPTERALIGSDATRQAFAAAYVRAIDRYFGR